MLRHGCISDISVLTAAATVARSPRYTASGQHLVIAATTLLSHICSSLFMLMAFISISQVPSRLPYTRMC